MAVLHGGEPTIGRAGWLASALAGAAPCGDIGFPAMLSGYFFGSVTAFGAPPGGSAFGLIEMVTASLPLLFAMPAVSSLNVRYSGPRRVTARVR